MVMSIQIILFYKYVLIESPQTFRAEHLTVCNEIGLKGRILVAKEGINGSVSGTQEQTEQYKSFICSDSRFADIIFKEETGISNPFKKMAVKVKKEIVNFGVDVNLNNTGEHITPKEFLDIYNLHDDVLIVDVRNEYESHVGKFKGATTLHIQTFREFPQKALEILGEKKDKKIVMYCTGGIRCEKASAYLKENGFKDVSQLNGGILTFGKEFPDSVWEGKCFVFDKRMTSSVNKEERPITNCELCDVPCDLYKNCANTNCDKYCIVCISCEQKLGGCCSQTCFKEKFKPLKNFEKKFIHHAHMV